MAGLCGLRAPASVPRRGWSWNCLLRTERGKSGSDVGFGCDRACGPRMRSLGPLSVVRPVKMGHAVVNKKRTRESTHHHLSAAGWDILVERVAVSESISAAIHDLLP